MINAESNGSRRSAAVEDPHPGEARIRRKVAHNNDNNYYSEQDESREQFSRKNGSGSDSRSGSRSRSPVYRARRDARSSYDRHKPSGEFNKRCGDQSGDYGWDNRDPKEMKYHNDEFQRRPGVMVDHTSDDSESDSVSATTVSVHTWTTCDIFGSSNQRIHRPNRINSSLS